MHAPKKYMPGRFDQAARPNLHCPRHRSKCLGSVRPRRKERFRRRFGRLCHRVVQEVLPQMSESTRERSISKRIAHKQYTIATSSCVVGTQFLYTRINVTQWLGYILLLYFQTRKKPFTDFPSGGQTGSKTREKTAWTRTSNPSKADWAVDVITLCPAKTVRRFLLKSQDNRGNFHIISIGMHAAFFSAYLQAGCLGLEGPQREHCTVIQTITAAQPNHLLSV
jgi:hypothetical protein